MRGCYGWYVQVTNGLFFPPDLGLQHVLAHFGSVAMDTHKQGLGKWSVFGTVGHSEDKCHFQFLTAGDLSWLPLASHPRAFSYAWKSGPLLCLLLGNVSSQAESNSVRRDRAEQRQGRTYGALL